MSGLFGNSGNTGGGLFGGSKPTGGLFGSAGNNEFYNKWKWTNYFIESVNLSKVDLIISHKNLSLYLILMYSYLDLNSKQANGWRFIWIFEPKSRTANFIRWWLIWKFNLDIKIWRWKYIRRSIWVIIFNFFCIWI